MNQSLDNANLMSQPLSYSLQFWILLIFAFLSFVTSIFIFIQFLLNQSMFSSLQNHSIFILVVANIVLILTDVIWMLDSFHHSGRVTFKTQSFCLTWWIFDFSLYTIQSMVLAWASVERHVLIFQRHVHATTNQRLAYHYFPLIVLISYLILFRIIVILFPPCSNEFDFDRIECGLRPCYFNILHLIIWDKLVHCIIPTLIIAVSNFALIYRIIAQKRRMHHPLQWRKHVRLSMQLIPITGVYLFLNLPAVIIYLIEILSKKEEKFSINIELYTIFSSYLVSFSVPFVLSINLIWMEKTRHVRVSPNISYVQNPKTIMRDISKNDLSVNMNVF